MNNVIDDCDGIEVIFFKNILIILPSLLNII